LKNLALANGACIANKDFGYLVLGVEDKTQKIIGTNFKSLPGCLTIFLNFDGNWFNKRSRTGSLRIELVL
jgi:predicted HTH transcriptional regulator